MPRLKNGIPKYRKHKASGRAVTTIAGRDHYLGPYGTKASQLEYDRLIVEWISAGRPTSIADDPLSITVAELIAKFWKFAQIHYRKNGKPTGTADSYKPALRLLRQFYGQTLVADFGPRALEALQHNLIERDLSRRYINDTTDRIRRVFRWGVSKEIVPVDVSQKLACVSNLAKHRSHARETEPCEPVSNEVVEATLPNLPPVIAAMVQFQRFTGCRPGEVCSLNPCEIDASSEVWIWRLGSHKTEHHGRTRVIPIGPRAQAILKPYLGGDASDCCFSPSMSERVRRQEAHQKRVTPLKHGNRPGTNRTSKPKRPPGSKYDTAAYRRAIHRACDKTFCAPAPLGQKADESAKEWRERLTADQKTELAKWQKSHRWSPNQLRHAAATEIRREFGLEATQVVLGHTNANVTEIYAERDFQLGIEVARKLG